MVLHMGNKLGNKRVIPHPKLFPMSSQGEDGVIIAVTQLSSIMMTTWPSKARTANHLKTDTAS